MNSRIVCVQKLIWNTDALYDKLNLLYSASVCIKKLHAYKTLICSVRPKLFLG